MSRAYDEGHYAGYHGEGDDTCPLPEGSEEYWDWMNGYFDGEEDWQEENS